MSGPVHAGDSYKLELVCILEVVAYSVYNILSVLVQELRRKTSVSREKGCEVG